MADESSGAEGIFRHSTMNRVASSEELDHYIKVTNPSAWVVVLAALLLVGGVVVWALTATVPVTVETTGIASAGDGSDDTEVICFVDRETANRIRKAGAKASVDNVETKNVQMSELPLSASEAINYLGSDFYADSIKLDDWNYLVTIKFGSQLRHTDFAIDTINGRAHLVPVSIIVSETEPINIVLGKKN